MCSTQYLARVQASFLIKKSCMQSTRSIDGSLVAMLNQWQQKFVYDCYLLPLLYGGIKIGNAKRECLDGNWVKYAKLQRRMRAWLERLSGCVVAEQAKKRGRFNSQPPLDAPDDPTRPQPPRPTWPGVEASSAPSVPESSPVRKIATAAPREPDYREPLSGTSDHNRTQTPDTRNLAEDEVVSKWKNRKEFSKSLVES